MLRRLIAVRSPDSSVLNRGSTGLGSHDARTPVSPLVSRSYRALAQPRLEVVCPRIPLGPTPRALILSAWLSTLLVLVLVSLTGLGHKQNDIHHNFKLNFQLQRAAALPLAEKERALPALGNSIQRTHSALTRCRTNIFRASSHSHLRVYGESCVRVRAACGAAWRPPSSHRPAGAPQLSGDSLDERVRKL
jgi:hypothetical protein